MSANVVIGRPAFRMAGVGNDAPHSRCASLTRSSGPRLPSFLRIGARDVDLDTVSGAAATPLLSGHPTALPGGEASHPGARAPKLTSSEVRGPPDRHQTSVTICIQLTEFSRLREQPHT